MAKKKSRSAKPGPDDPVDFETALEQVERIVGELEGGELGLTESLERYERGVRQLKNCHAILDQAERRVTMLSGFDADGNPVTESMPQSDPTTMGNGGGENALGEGDSGSEGSSLDDSPGLF